MSWPLHAGGAPPPWQCTLHHAVLYGEPPRQYARRRVSQPHVHRVRAPQHPPLRDNARSSKTKKHTPRGPNSDPPPRGCVYERIRRDVRVY